MQPHLPLKRCRLLCSLPISPSSPPSLLAPSPSFSSSLPLGTLSLLSWSFLLPVLSTFLHDPRDPELIICCVLVSGLLGTRKENGNLSGCLILAGCHRLTLQLWLLWPLLLPSKKDPEDLLLPSPWSLHVLYVLDSFFPSCLHACFLSSTFFFWCFDYWKNLGSFGLLLHQLYILP